MPERTALVTALILDRPMCVECVSAKGGVSLVDTDAVIARMASVLRVRSEPGRCRECGTTTQVFSVERPK